MTVFSVFFFRRREKKKKKKLGNKDPEQNQNLFSHFFQKERITVIACRECYINDDIFLSRGLNNLN